MLDSKASREAIACVLTASHPQSITEGGPRAEFMVKIWNVHAVSASMTVAVKVGRALCKEHVGIYNVGIMLVEKSSESFDGCQRLSPLKAHRLSISLQSRLSSLFTRLDKTCIPRWGMQRLVDEKQQHYLHSNGCYTLNRLGNLANGIYAS